MTDKTISSPLDKLRVPELPTQAPGEAPASEQRELEAPKEPTAETTAVEISAPATGLKRFMRRPKRVPVTIPQTRDEVTVRIEKIMEDGIGDAYSRLSPVAKQEFKLQGEQTARAIQDLLRATHVQVKKLFRLILMWLKMLPGVNHFFLEQEAKIKADRILAIKDQLLK